MNGVLVKRRRHRYEAVLELTPLIDVIFLLLIFFMVSILSHWEILIQLPESSGATAESKLEALVIGERCQNFSVNGSVLSGTGTDEITAFVVTSTKWGGCTGTG